MPEGHTIHRLALTLERAFGGTRPEVSSPQGRFADGAALLDGRLLERAEAWGKHLFLTFEGDRILHIHLGLIGIFDVTQYASPTSPQPLPPPVGAVRVRLASATHVADLRGAMIVDLITPEQQDAVLTRLGPDPLRAGTDGNEPERALAVMARTGRTFAEVLMDQSVLAGVGNLYRCEVLFRHRVDPFRPAKQIRPQTFHTVWDDLVDLLSIGVAFGQIITMDDQLDQAREIIAGQGEQASDAYRSGRLTLVDWRGADEAELGQRRPAYEEGSAFPREFYVYQRDGQACYTCGSRIRTQVLAGRNLFWCGRCQRRR
ncbi:MAG TPA: Fpg/Nei family DNA glycosylase [Intrasporangiaceae bacterium]|nr:Fpg/Nei family DNA glycosylase [Intrasporangiaceae bacterium]